MFWGGCGYFAWVVLPSRYGDILYFVHHPSLAVRKVNQGGNLTAPRHPSQHTNSISPPLRPLPIRHVTVTCRQPWPRRVSNQTPLSMQGSVHCGSLCVCSMRNTFSRPEKLHVLVVVRSALDPKHNVGLAP